MCLIVAVNVKKLGWIRGMCMWDVLISDAVMLLSFVDFILIYFFQVVIIFPLIPIAYVGRVAQSV